MLPALPDRVQACDNVEQRLQAQISMPIEIGSRCANVFLISWSAQSGNICISVH